MDLKSKSLNRIKSEYSITEHELNVIMVELQSKGVYLLNSDSTYLDKIQENAIVSTLTNIRRSKSNLPSKSEVRQFNPVKVQPQIRQQPKPSNNNGVSFNEDIFKKYDFEYFDTTEIKQ